MLKIAGGEASFTRFSSAIYKPDVAIVSAQAATTMAAPGAADVDHSVSRIASPSSELTPGSEQLLAPLAGAGCTVVSEPEVYCESPKTLRNVFQSAAVYKSVSSMTLIVCPIPVIPL